MPDFTGTLTMDDVEKIKTFIQGTADAIRPKKEGAARPGRPRRRRAAPLPSAAATAPQ